MNATPPTDRGSTQIHIEAECVIDGFGGKFVERPMRISTVNSDLGHTFVAAQDAACRNIFLEKLGHQSRTALPLLGLYRPHRLLTHSRSCPSNYSITSAAMAGGRPTALAGVRFTTRSAFVGC